MDMYSCLFARSVGSGQQRSGRIVAKDRFVDMCIPLGTEGVIMGHVSCASQNTCDGVRCLWRQNLTRVCVGLWVKQ